MKTFFKVSILLVVLAAFVIGFIYLSNLSSGTRSSFGTSKEEKMINGSAITKIDCRSNAADISILPNEHSDQITIQLDGKRWTNKNKLLQVKQKNEQLIIQVSNHTPKINFGGKSANLKLTVQLPKKRYEEAFMKSKVGDLLWKDIDVNQLTFENNVGDSKGSNISAKEVKVTTNVGDTRIENVKSKKMMASSNTGDTDFYRTNGSLTIYNDVGDVHLDQVMIAGDITIENNIGDIQIKTAKPLNDVQVDLKTRLGEIEVESKEFLQKRHTNRQWQEKIGDGKYTIKATTGVGDIALKN